MAFNIEQAIKEMEEKAKEDQGKGLINQQKKITATLNKLYSYAAVDSSQLGDAASSAFTRWRKSKHYWPMDFEENNFSKTEAMKEGYSLLNKIGENIRNDKITYSIIVTDPKTFHQYIWEDISHKDFVDNFIALEGFGQLGLKDSSTILNKMKRVEVTKEQEKIQKTKKYKEASKIQQKKMLSETQAQIRDRFDQGISNFLWNGSQEYKDFNERARKLENGRWQKVTKGNTAEAFLRLQGAPNGMTDYDAMLTTMSAPIAFFKGGDIGTKQIKSDFASVTNISTLIANLEKAHSLLGSIIDGVQSTNSSQSQGIAATAEKEIIKNTEKAIQEYVAMFFP